MLSLFNKLHPNLTFTMELDDMRINFSDLTIHRLTDSVYASIYEGKSVNKSQTDIG
jgi:hypothetical protein